MNIKRNNSLSPPYDEISIPACSLPFFLSPGDMDTPPSPSPSRGCSSLLIRSFIQSCAAYVHGPRRIHHPPHALLSTPVVPDGAAPRTFRPARVLIRSTLCGTERREPV